MKFIFIIISILFLVGCKSKKSVEFCEGVSTEGTGVNCGERFSTGEITLIIKSDSVFETERLSIDVYKKEKYKTEKTESLFFDVNPEEKTAKANLYFYDEGDFLVEVRGIENRKIAEGNVTIIDVY
jgi:hypothetical protein